MGKDTSAPAVLPRGKRGVRNPYYNERKQANGEGVTDFVRMQDELRRLCRAEGGCSMGISFLTAWWFTGKEVQMPQTENPYLYLVLDGMFRLYTPSGILDYTAGQYSISKIDTPLRGTVLAPSAHGDLLAFSAEFTVHDVITTVLGLDNSLTDKITAGGYPPFANGKIAGGIGVGGGTEEQDCAIAEHVVSVFEQLAG